MTDRPVVFLTTNLPSRPGEGDTALRAAGPDAFFDAIEMLSEEGRTRLETYASGRHTDVPLPGFWSDQDVQMPPFEFVGAYRRAIGAARDDVDLSQRRIWQ